MFRVVAEIPWQTLEDRIRHTPLLMPRDGQQVFPYLDAEITLAEIAYDDVRPTSLYILHDNIALQTELADDLAPDHDPLALQGGLKLVGDDGREVGLVRQINHV